MRILFIWLWLINIAGCAVTARVEPPTERQVLTEAAVVKKVASEVEGQATLFWNPPKTNMNGAPVIDVAGYKIYYGIKRGQYPDIIDVNDPSATSYTISNLSPGTYYFVVTAYNRRGYESTHSNVAKKTIPHKAPQK